MHLIHIACWVPVVAIKAWIHANIPLDPIKAFLIHDHANVFVLLSLTTLLWPLLVHSNYWIPQYCIDGGRRFYDFFAVRPTEVPQEVSAALERALQSSLASASGERPRQILLVDQKAHAADTHERMHMVELEAENPLDTTGTPKTPDTPKTPNTSESPDAPNTPDIPESSEQACQPRESPLDHITQGPRRTNRSMPPRRGLGRPRITTTLTEEWVTITASGYGLESEINGNMARCG